MIAAACCLIFLSGVDATGVKGGADSPLFRVRTEVSGVDYRNISGAAGQLPIIEQNGQGIGAVDYDGDGRIDLFVPNGSTETRWRSGKNPGCKLFRNLGGWRFADVTDDAGVRGNAWSNGVAVADYDADGDFDIYCLNWGADVLYRNNGDGTYTDVTARTGVGTPGWSSSAAFADFNGDGLLDIYVTSYVHFDYDAYPKTEKDGKPCLYHGIETGCGPWCYDGARDTLYLGTQAGGTPDGRFEDRSLSAGLACTAGFRGFGVVAVDLDHDRDIDLYVGCDVMPNLYLENLGDGRFRSVGLQKGGAYNVSGQHESGMGVAAADFDRSGTIDFITTNFASEKNTFYRNQGGLLTDRSAAIQLDRHRTEMGWGVVIEDFNQDGRLDVFVANGHIYPQIDRLNDPAEKYASPPRLYLQTADGRLREVDTRKAFGLPIAFSLRGCASVDLDNDGDMDLVAVQHNGPLVFLENLSNRASVLLELIDARGGCSPMGAKVTVAGGGTHWLLPNQGYQSSHDHRIHIARPSLDTPLRLELLWPRGRREQRVIAPGRTGVVRLKEPSRAVGRLEHPAGAPMKLE